MTGYYSREASRAYYRRTYGKSWKAMWKKRHKAEVITSKTKVITPDVAVQKRSWFTKLKESISYGK